MLIGEADPRQQGRLERASRRDLDRRISGTGLPFVRDPRLPGLPSWSPMCNAPNHSPSCDCGFGGDTGSRGWRWDSVLTLATKLDAAALYAVGRFLLWDLDDPISARQYLEAALERAT